ncbi:MAG: 50S ribosomal protein L21 [Pseudomonadota bacterium]
MFAIVRTGGKQYRVAPGDKIVVEKLDGNAGDKITLGDILLAGEGADLKSVDGLKVSAEILAQAKADKVTVFKKRRRHNYRRKAGHRQLHTILQITAIGDHKMEKKAAPKAAAGTDDAPKAEAAKDVVNTAAKAETKQPAKVAAKPAAEAAAKPAAKAAAKPAAKPAPKAAAKAPAKAATAAAPKAAKKPATKNAAPAKAAAKKSPKKK